MKKITLKRVALFLIFSLLGAELFARFYLGLGTPPLFMAHPAIEFLLKPNQDIKRFGNHFIVNQYSMRSENFEPHKTDGNQTRVLVFGDSVINGGSLTDHDALATSILQARWRQKTGRPFVVGNISVGSWGPGNWLAYAREYGFFDADVVVLVASSHDAYNPLTFAPLNPATHPEQGPLSALSEGVNRYLPRYFSGLFAEKTNLKSETYAPVDKKTSLPDFRQFIELAKQKANKVIVFLHATRAEAETGNMDEGYQEIVNLLNQESVPFIAMQPMFHAQMAQQDLYREGDIIHPSVLGQKLIADIIENNIPPAWFAVSQSVSQ